MSLMVMYFFVSGRAKVETGIDDSTKSIADKIADLMGLKRCSL
jgi:antitoxin component of RelBE/YafQ-DinJ toxin-antitoxin module